VTELVEYVDIKVKRYRHHGC